MIYLPAEKPWRQEFQKITEWLQGRGEPQTTREIAVCALSKELLPDNHDCAKNQKGRIESAFIKNFLRFE